MCKISAAVIAVAIVLLAITIATSATNTNTIIATTTPFIIPSATSAADVSPVTPQDRQWIQLESNSQCDVGAGEVYQKQSSVKLSDLAACQQSCEDDPGCQSITYYKGGWCSHFSTGCMRRKINKNAMISTRWGGFVQAMAVTAGWKHSVVVNQDGSLWTTGMNDKGQLGYGSRIDKHSFVKVIDGDVKAVAAGGYHTMVVKQDGSLWATGDNYPFGQLGDGSKTDKLRHKFSFVKVITSGVTAVAAGGWHTMVLKQDGSLWATGSNYYGQLGKQTNEHSFVKVMSNNVKAVAAGDEHTMVVKQDGSLWVTGRNDFGRLGDGSTVDKRSFVKVITSGVKAVSAGLDHSMVVKQDGSMWATGNNLSGKLGDGSRRDKHRFVKVIASGVKAVAAGDHHSMVLKQDGSLWATGSNEYGQLGDGSRRDKIIFVEVIPTTMPGSSTTEAVVELAAGGYHSMLVKQDGSLWTAGRNDFGQLGDGSRTEKNSFILVTTSSTTTSSSTVSLVTPKGCKKWCARNEKEWTQKCTWSATCAGCSECLVSTTKAATTASIRCKKWCAAHKQFWKTKCTWSASCAGCFECLGAMGF